MTAAGKITTAALKPGCRILLAKQADGTLDVAHRKTGALQCTVTGITTAQPGPYDRQRRYIVSTDMGDTVSLAPAQTHWLAPAGRQ